MTLTFEWLDREREPQNPPQPEFPNGTDVDMSAGAAKACSIDLPYPAKRCGVYVISCSTCGQNNAITTAGRTDDPRKVTFGCYAHGLSRHMAGSIEVVLPGSEKMKRTPHPGDAK